MTSQRSLTLFVRSLAPAGAGGNRRTAIDRLETLVDRSVIDSYRVEVWGRRVVHDGPISETKAARSVHDQLAAFERWAERSGVAIEPFFSRSTIDSTLTGETREVTDLPVVALAEYENGRLAHLTPHEGDDGVETVLDRLETLESERPPTQGGAVAALD